MQSCRDGRDSGRFPAGGSRQLVSYCDQIGALPILIIPPANEAGYEPGRSTISLTVPADERRRLVDAFREARSLESRDPEASALGYGAILARHPDFAEAHFRLARLLERQGRVTEAGSHYLAALDNDGLPLRCQAPFRAAFHEVANRHPRAILIDGRRELIAISPDGLIGDHVIHDTHHPTLRGYLALAGAVLRELARREVFGPVTAFELPIEPAVCARHFGMNAEKWVNVCDRISEHYRRVAGYRYDPAERLEKSRRYAEAAQRMWHGKPIGDLGLPGLLDAAPPQPTQNLAIPDFGVQDGRPLRSSLLRLGICRPEITLPETWRGGSFDDLFDLPVLQVDHRAAAQEADHGHELIALRPADHLSDHAGQRASRDSNSRPDGHHVFRGDRQARAQHGVNLLEVACQRVLIYDLDHTDQSMGAQRGQAVVEISLQEQVAHEERHNRLDFPPLGRAGLFQHLGQVIDDPQGAEVAGRRFFLTRLCMQAPPNRLTVRRMDQRVIP